MYFVYELIDPRNNVTGYIGITSNPNRRYSEHIEGREGSGKKYEWIKRLQEEHIQPKMKILEVVDDLEQARRQERYWIQQHLGKGTQLANTFLIDSTRKAEKRVPKIQPPKGYYTRDQALDKLSQAVSEPDMVVVWFRDYINRGIIGRIRPERCKYCFYLKSDVDRLADELRRFFA